MSQFEHDLIVYLWVYPVISHKLTHKYHGRLKSNSVILFGVCILRGERREYPDLIEPPEHP